MPPKEDVQGIYEKFIPLNFSDFESEEDYTTFTIQEIDEYDNVTITYTDNFSYFAYARECVNQIWKGSAQSESDLFLI